MIYIYIYIYDSSSMDVFIERADLRLNDIFIRTVFSLSIVPTCLSCDVDIQTVGPVSDFSS